ncbi:hypothetical protein ACM9XC_16480 [Xanthomonas sacchari]
MDRQPPAGNDPGCGLSDAARLLQRSVSSAATAAAILARLGDATFDRIANRCAPHSPKVEVAWSGRPPATSPAPALASAWTSSNATASAPPPPAAIAFNATTAAAQVASLASSEHLLQRSSFVACPTWRGGDGSMAATSITPLPTAAPRT